MTLSSAHGFTYNIMYKIILFSDECQVWVPLQDTDYGYSGNILVKDPLAQNIFK